MNKFQAFQKFAAAESAQIPVLGFVFNLFLAALLSFLLARVYVAYGTSLSNRRMFARNFVMITMTTLLVIAIVKSSLALSLGLVGALSIVRFRAAIKEPEELAYLFLAIAIGLGFGADQRVITVVAVFIIVCVLILRKQYHGIEGHQNIYLTVSSDSGKSITLKDIVEILGKSCKTVNMRRFDETKENMEAAFLVDCEDIDKLQTVKTELQGLDDSLRISFLSNKGDI
ncbi:MAG: DUF4956 domain-containing protein [Candidatus Omnitrophica bacterium]|nr:DUF4956 domain-containing protein [Candidatus Omnitrophota bacterium]